MRLFTVDKKTIKKNLLHFMNSEPVVMGRPGPPPRAHAGRARWGPVPERNKKIGKTRRKNF